MNSVQRSVLSFLRYIAAGVLLAVAAPAHALNPGDSVPLSSSPGLASNQTFIHNYPFMLGVTSGIDYLTYRIDFPPPFSITSFAATLFSGTTALISGTDGSPVGALVPNSFLLGALGPGSYLLRISGFASGTSGVDSYAGLLRVTAPLAPIPEPEVWAMMLVGMGLVGLRVRRKLRLDGARRFA